MSEIEKMKRYIARPQSGKFPIGTRYQMCTDEMRELFHMSQADAICLAFDTMAAPKATARRKRRCGDER